MSTETVLGPQVARHQGTFRVVSYLQYIGAFLLVLGVLGVTGLGQNIDPNHSGTPLEGLGALALGALAYAPFVYWWRQEVVVYEQGFVWRRLTGTRTVQRTEIRSVRPIKVSHFLLGQYEEVEVTLRDGRRLSMVRVQEAGRLSRLLAANSPIPAER
ncbi:hypothetical protein [Streptacidiphilus sp. EB129]|uniref:hypothetical protein n=1 Tax=Streptacidiphilus sp. EB129 TaxID=3156262 RepID=UPI00351444F9